MIVGIHMKSVALALVVVTAIVATKTDAGEYLDARIEGKSLAITSRLHGAFDAPMTESEQAGFTDAAISEDGNTVGWVTLEYVNASYPYAVSLVLFRGGKVMRIFSEFGTLTKWKFSGNDAVVVLRELPHGLEFLGFFHYRISDGALLSEYRCGYVSGPDGDELVQQGPVPEWAAALGAHCPSAEDK